MTKNRLFGLALISITVGCGNGTPPRKSRYCIWRTGAKRRAASSRAGSPPPRREFYWPFIIAGFDRVVFHQQLHAPVLAFFQKHLMHSESTAIGP